MKININLLALQIILVIAKLAIPLSVSWWIIFIPLLIPVAFIGLALAFILLGLILSIFTSKD